MKKKDKYNRGARTYLESAVKAASHPIRNQILRNLKKGSLSTIDLEEMVGENRYNLYHHLEVLIRSNLICEDVSSGKMKRYRMNVPKKPEVGVLLFNQDDIKNNLSSWYKMLSILEEIEGEKIPIKSKIKEIEVHLKY
jgi:DNA-binding transcriptional ArsR family regulator